MSNFTEKTFQSVASRQSFLLRIWQPHATAHWCFQLRDIDDGDDRVFESPEKLVAFLMASVSAETTAGDP